MLGIVLDDLDLIPAPGAWAEHGLCVTLDADVFTASPKPPADELAVAAKLCRRCPVRQDCAAYAQRYAGWGLWAGYWYDRTPGSTPNVTAA
jgi:hypothetical protein